MGVFGTEMHIIVFLVSLFELVFFFYQVIHYLSRPSEKSRLYYLILLYLLIQYNIVSGLLPDKNIPISIVLQNILAFSVSIIMAMYLPFYFYKVFDLKKLKFYAYRGSFIFLFIPFILCFIIPYYITKNLESSRRLLAIVPFFYSVSFLYSLIRAIIAKYLKNKDGNYKEEIIGAFAILFWVCLPVKAFFQTDLDIILEPLLHFKNGSETLVIVLTNIGLLIMTILFIKQAVRQSKEEYQKLLISERALQELNSELIIKVKERTHELELANEKRTNSFVNLAHETKTPLTLINNYLEEYINKHGETKELKVIKNSLGKLTKDIVNFFDLERINKGFSIYDHNQISDFSKILKEKIILFRQYANKKNIKITELIDDELFVKADPESIYRVINTGVSSKITLGINLIENGLCFPVSP